MTTRPDGWDPRILERLLETTQEGFWYIDTETLTIDVNPAMCTNTRPLEGRDHRPVDL